MKLENQVCSLELARRLKELGVKQDSYFVWSRFWGENSMGDRITFTEPRACEDALAQDPYLEETLSSAFTVAELGEMLPARCRTHKSFSPDSDQDHQWVMDGEGDRLFYGATEADARAKMLVHLLENKLIKPSKTYFDRIVSEVCMNERPICPDCAKQGFTNVRMEVGSHPPLPDPTFGCEGHHLSYHPFVGYQAAGRSSEIGIPYLCPKGCGVGMYIASVESGIAKLECPQCSHETSLQL